MKTRTIIFFSALLALTSCGSAAQYASDTSSQRYQDGIFDSEETAWMQEYVDDIYTRFVNIVAEGRGMTYGH